MALQYSPEAQTVMHAASSLTAFYRKTVLTPELLLLALVQDDAVRAVWPEAASPSHRSGGASPPHRSGGASPSHRSGGASRDARLEAHLLADESPGDKDGWSAPAKRALHAAWDRAGARRRFVGPGDLLSGLAGAGGLAGALVSDAAIAISEVDARAAEPETPKAGSVLLYDDSTTPMDFVVATLREVLGCTQPRAVYCMYRTHFLGKAAVGPFADAEARVQRVAQMVRESGFPFRVEVAPTR